VNKGKRHLKHLCGKRNLSTGDCKLTFKQSFNFLLRTVLAA